MTTHRLFVCGTLKRGQPNHEQFAPAYGIAKYVGQARTVEKFPLVIASSCNIPYLLDKQGTGNQVFGEIYEVDDKMLQHCDEFENSPAYYQRVPIQVRLFEDSAGSPVQEMEQEEVSVYILRNYKEFMLDLPYLDNYDNNGPHGLKYKSRNDPFGKNASHQSEVQY